MKTENRSALTPIELCALIAHEAVSLLEADANAVNCAVQLREGLDIFASANELSEIAEPLLAWVDRAVENARQFITAGRALPHLLDPEQLLPAPDAAAQLDAVWMLFQAAVHQPKEKRQALLDTARTLTEMGGLEDVLLTVSVPSGDTLTAEDLRAELADVRAALQGERQGPNAAPTGMEQP